VAFGMTCVAVGLPATALDLDQLQKRGVLRVLVVRVAGHDDFFTIERRDPPGFDREVVEGFAALQRLRLQVVPVRLWDELIPALLAGRADMIAGRFTVTEERRKQISFSREVFPTRPVVVTRRPTPRVATLEALRQVRIGTLRGSSLAEAVRRAGVPASKTDDTLAPGTLPVALAKGQVEAIVLGVENAITAQREDPQLELGLFLGEPGSLAYGLRREDAALLSALDRYIDALRAAPSWSQLVVKYFGANAPEILKMARGDLDRR
jgi:ABC-type amino acid transport substrate-binding protein